MSSTFGEPQTHNNRTTGEFNIVGNYFKRGPSDSLSPFFFDDEAGGAQNPRYYLNDNYIDDPANHVGSVDDPWATLNYFTIDYHGWNSELGKVNSLQNFNSVNITTQDSVSAYNAVLDKVGSFPRDQMLLDDVSETKNRTGSWSSARPSLTDGLTPSSAPTDSDGDGMSDIWESSNGLNSSVKDHNTVMSSGYTAIEDYINEMADQLVN